MAEPSSQSIDLSAWTPPLLALAVGLLLGPLIANQFGWTVTNGAARAATRDAVVRSEASICVARARADVAEPGKLDPVARAALARKWALMPGADSIDAAVMQACVGELHG